MSGMAEVLAAHAYNSVHDCCTCNEWSFYENPGDGHAAHVADELAQAGYGKVREAQKRLREATGKLRQLKKVVETASLYGSVECDELDAILDGAWSPAWKAERAAGEVRSEHGRS